jgi:gamma-glutamyltranspeptidase / glutathione hydrolase
MARRARTLPAGVLVVLLAACSSVDPGGSTGTSSGPTGQAPDVSATTTTGDTRTATVPPRPTTAESTEDAGLGAYGVSAGHPAAVDTGLAVLAQGGSAVDAAVAAALVMGVVEPFSSGLGGGGVAIVVPGDTEEPPVAYDYTEEVWRDGSVPPSGTGVPGYLAGLVMLHDEHGELAWADLVAPAVTLAADGVPTTALLADQLRSDLGVPATTGLEQFRPGGLPLAEGDLLVQQELADTLRLVAAAGAAAFYDGPLSRPLSQVQGIDEASLTAYRVQRGEPARGPVGDHEVLGAAPPLSGAALIQLLQVAEAAGVAEVEPGGADYVDLMSAAWQVAHETIATQLGDPEFHDVPLEEITDPARNATLARERPAPAAQGPPDLSANTTHVSVVAPDGTAVAMTHTITGFWGSGHEVGGFFLNNHLVRFGLSRTEANEPEPGRRTTSYMAPAVVLDEEGRPVLVLGTPGGERIPSVLATVIARWALHGQPLEDAVAAPRFHLDGGRLLTEPLPEAVATELRARGRTLVPVGPELLLFGSVQVLEVDHDEGRVTGTRDTRREGDWGASN